MRRRHTHTHSHLDPHSGFCLVQDDWNSLLWNVVMLAMGGLALGEAVTSSGLLLEITRHLQALVCMRSCMKSYPSHHASDRAGQWQLPQKGLVSGIISELQKAPNCCQLLPCMYMLPGQEPFKVRSINPEYGCTPCVAPLQVIIPWVAAAITSSTPIISTPIMHGAW